MLYSWMILGYNELKSMTSTYRSHKPLLGSKTRPPLYLSRLAFAPLPLPFPPPPSPSSSNSSLAIFGVVFLPHVLSGQMYFSRWNSCNRMYSFRSARPPFRVLFLSTMPRNRELSWAVKNRARSCGRATGDRGGKITVPISPYPGSEFDRPRREAKPEREIGMRRTMHCLPGSSVA